MRDWTGRWVGRTPAVLRPSSTDEVAAVVRACAEWGVAIVPQGGNTGLVGGAIPLQGEVVLDLTRMAQVSPVDLAAGQLTAGAGARLLDLQEAAAAVGLQVGIDLASRHSATLGGMVATNAGGVHVVRWGTTRHQLLGIEAVLGDGSVVSHLQGLAKDATGYDLAGLLCGSEGTLGVVTRACLRLVAPPRERAVALVGVASIVDAIAALARWRVELVELLAAELVVAPGIELVCDALGLARPLPERWAAHLLVEVGGSRPLAELSAVLADDPALGDAAVADDSSGRASLWRYREGMTEALHRQGPVIKLDVSVPQVAMARFLTSVSDRVEDVAPDAQTHLFGHLGDGNIHVNVTGAEPHAERVEDAVLTLVADHGGAISAEHGIGVAKRRWLHLSRTPAEIAAFRAIKAALDPAGILAPGVLLPEE